MAISVQNLQPGDFGFILNAVSADASGCEELKAAPATTGEKLVINTLSITTGAALDVTIGQGETGGSVTSTLLGPITMAEDSTSYFDFQSVGGLVLAANTSLVVDASGAGAVCVVATGRVK